jgi:hypothetical protein
MALASGVIDRVLVTGNAMCSNNALDGSSGPPASQKNQSSGGRSMFSRMRVRVLVILPSLLAVGAGMLMAQTNPHQSRSTSFGTSGGNINNISKAFCCSGTLGSLVSSSGGQYILSNNHVLADADQAASGEDISQPGLIDNNCRPATIVADFTVAPHFGTNVDAALAALRAGQMDSRGTILDIGVPNSSPLNASTNLLVAKSGRTTGLSCGSVQSTNTSVKVQYQQGCNQGKKFTITYTNQVVVGGSGFSAGGDSGSLIVSQTGKRPTALLFAGSSSTTIGNPINEVLSQLTTSLGSAVSFVGTSNPGNVTCPAAGGGSLRGRPSQTGLDRATVAKEAHAQELMADPAVMAIGVGSSERNPAEAVVNVYVETGRAHGLIPAELDGVRTQIIRTDLIRAYGWNEPQRQAASNSCLAKAR